MGVKWHLTGAFVCISLMTQGVERLFRCLLAMRIYSLERCLFAFFAYLLIEADL